MKRDLTTGRVIFEETQTKLEMSFDERNKASVLVIEPDTNVRNRFREVLNGIDFTNQYLANDHVSGLKILESRNFTHIIFPAADTNMPASDFLRTVMDFDPNTVALPTSNDPNVDDVFELLQLGARGY